jgi:transposase InsO family protein
VWRAGCSETGTSGSEGGPRKRTSCKAGTAPRSDPYTKLLGPSKWTYYYLYVVLDIYSRYVVGWLLADRELATLAEQLLADTIQKEGIAPEQLTIHADRGSSMASKPVALLLADLGVTKTHSRPHVSNDCDDCCGATPG